MTPPPGIGAILSAPAAGGPLGKAVTLLDGGVRMLCGAILWLTFLAMFLPTLANAVLRYTTDDSLVWSVEIVQLTFPWFIVAGAVLAAQHGRHIGVLLLPQMLPAGAARFLALAGQMFIVLACGGIVYVYAGFGRFDGGMQFAAGAAAFTSLNISQSWSYLSILAGYIMLGLTALTAAYRLCFDAAR